MRLLINIDVPDLPAAIDFYTRGLGFCFRRCLFSGTVAELEYGAVRIYLIAQSAGSIAVEGRPERRTYADHWTPVHLDLVVVNLDVALQTAVTAGATAAVVRDMAFGRLVAMRDPFGHGICLIEFNDRGYDAAQ